MAPPSSNLQKKAPPTGVDEMKARGRVSINQTGRSPSASKRSGSIVNQNAQSTKKTFAASSVSRMASQDTSVKRHKTGSSTTTHPPAPRRRSTPPTDPIQVSQLGSFDELNKSLEESKASKLHASHATKEYTGRIMEMDTHQYQYRVTDAQQAATAKLQQRLSRVIRMEFESDRALALEPGKELPYEERLEHVNRLLNKMRYVVPNQYATCLGDESGQPTTWMSSHGKVAGSVLYSLMRDNNGQACMAFGPFQTWDFALGRCFAEFLSCFMSGIQTPDEQMFKLKFFDFGSELAYFFDVHPTFITFPPWVPLPVGFGKDEYLPN